MEIAIDAILGRELVPEIIEDAINKGVIIATCVWDAEMLGGIITLYAYDILKKKSDFLALLLLLEIAGYSTTVTLEQIK